MPDQNQKIYLVILISSILALLLVGFILTIYFLYQRKRQKQEQEFVKVKDQFDQELLRSQLEIQESTFKVITQELHDNIGQVLSVVKLSLSVLPIEKDHPAWLGVQNCRDMLNKVIYDMANLTKSLHSDRISQIGITEAIRFDLDILRRNGLIEVDFNVSGKEYSMQEQKAIFMFRMFQEIMNNILKHARAKKVNVSIIYSIDNKFVLRVEDNGIGFDLENKQNQLTSSSGIGLKNMLNRARLIGADLAIQSSPGQGTVITVELSL
jgi:two-component system, NarL family, sensor kinase